MGRVDEMVILATNSCTSQITILDIEARKECFNAGSALDEPKYPCEKSQKLRKSKGLFGFWCFHHPSLYFHHSSLKNDGTHREKTYLDLFSSFVSITQFSDF